MYKCMRDIYSRDTVESVSNNRMRIFLLRNIFNLRTSFLRPFLKIIWNKRGCALLSLPGPRIAGGGRLLHVAWFYARLSTVWPPRLKIEHSLKDDFITFLLYAALEGHQTLNMLSYISVNPQNPTSTQSGLSRCISNHSSVLLITEYTMSRSEIRMHESPHAAPSQRGYQYIEAGLQLINKIWPDIVV